MGENTAFRTVSVCPGSDLCVDSTCSITPPDSQKILSMFKVGVKIVFCCVHDCVTVQPQNTGNRVLKGMGPDGPAVPLKALNTGVCPLSRMVGILMPDDLKEKGSLTLKPRYFLSSGFQTRRVTFNPHPTLAQPCHIALL